MYFFIKHVNSSNENYFVGGDFNNHVGNHKTGIFMSIKMAVLNENGKLLRNFEIFNELKITNPFFQT